jgi:GNAT superfamily N-acetyltransferase
VLRSGYTGRAMPAHVSLRPGEPHELPTVIEIDDQAGALYADAGLVMGLPPSHPFALAEAARWREALALGRLQVAVIPGELSAVAFASVRLVDAEPYLDQLSVRPAFMRQGIGRRLVQWSASWARERGAPALWLTTYAHLSWNGPYYERLGFHRCRAGEGGPELEAILESQRQALPHPEQRIAMRLAV